MKYDLIGGDRDGQVLCLLEELESIQLIKMPDPCVSIGDWNIERSEDVTPIVTYTLRVFYFYGHIYKCYALDVLTDSQACNIAIKRVMA